MNLTSMMRVWLTRSRKPFEFTSQYDKTLDFSTEENLGLYVHIPFCRSICSFCPYCKVVYDKDLAEKYFNALISEIKMVGKSAKTKRDVTSLYFGGGSPALMAEHLGEIISEIKKYFNILGGVGVELHPTDVSDELLATLKSAGVTMISVGIQSFDKTCINALGRKPPDTKSIFLAIKKANFETVDMDLIFAIPGQTAEILKRDIDTAFANGATQISTYPFIDFTFADNKYKPLGESEKKKMLFEITKHCKENGYNRTSVWTFAKANTEKYSSITRDNFIGFGVSATTLLKNQFKINTFSIEEYCKRIDKNQLATALTLKFTPRQRMVYYLFWSAYSMKVDRAAFKGFFGKRLEKTYGFEIFMARLLGMARKNEDGYELTTKGAYYYHYIEQAYTTAYIDKMWNISRKIAFPDKIVLK